MHFWKLESIGNDFPLVQPPRDFPAGDLNKLAIKLCDRRKGIGGDGLLAVTKQAEGLLLRMFNPDGTEDFCGNGIRCAAHFAYQQGLFGSSFTISHLNRSIPVTIEGQSIRTEIGVATYDPEIVPLAEGSGESFEGLVYKRGEFEVVGSALSTGSTHVVIPVATLPSTEEVNELGHLIENFTLYPARTSVIWREVIHASKVKIRIWERGVGETFGCGTGSAAAAVDHLRSINQGGWIQVENPGGTVTVKAEAWNQPISVEGTARLVYEGDYSG